MTKKKGERKQVSHRRVSKTRLSGTSPWGLASFFPPAWLTHPALRNATQKRREEEGGAENTTRERKKSGTAFTTCNTPVPSPSQHRQTDRALVTIVISNWERIADGFQDLSLHVLPLTQFALSLWLACLFRLADKALDGYTTHEKEEREEKKKEKGKKFYSTRKRAKWTSLLKKVFFFENLLFYFPHLHTHIHTQRYP